MLVGLDTRQPRSLAAPPGRTAYKRALEDAGTDVRALHTPRTTATMGAMQANTIQLSRMQGRDGAVQASRATLPLRAGPNVFRMPTAPRQTPLMILKRGKCVYGFPPFHLRRDGRTPATCPRLHPSIEEIKMIECCASKFREGERVACRFPGDKCPYANHLSTPEFDAEFLAPDTANEKDVLEEANEVDGM